MERKKHLEEVRRGKERQKASLRFYPSPSFSAFENKSNGEKILQGSF